MYFLDLEGALKDPLVQLTHLTDNAMFHKQQRLNYYPVVYKAMERLWLYIAMQTLFLNMRNRDGK